MNQPNYLSDLQHFGEKFLKKTSLLRNVVRRGYAVNDGSSGV